MPNLDLRRRIKLKTNLLYHAQLLYNLAKPLKLWNSGSVVAGHYIYR